MQERRIALVGAMPMEVEPYLTRIGDARREECGPFVFHLGTACGVPVAVLCCGIGKVNAAMAVQALIGRLAPGLVLHSGVGGSLTAGLGLLDALIARDCVQYDVDTTALGDPPGMISTIRPRLAAVRRRRRGRPDGGGERGRREREVRPRRDRRPLSLLGGGEARHRGGVRRADLRSGERRHRAGLLRSQCAVRRGPRGFRRHGRRPWR